MKKESVDRIIGLSAILISLMTLVMFIYQTNIMNKQSRLSVTPRIGFNSHLTHLDSLVTFTLSMKNKGIGPAIIRNAEIEYKEQSYSLDIYEVFEKEDLKLLEYGNISQSTTVNPGSTLSSGEAMILFSYEFSLEYLEKVQADLKIQDIEDFPINFIVEYTSMYDERWIVRSTEKGGPLKL